MAKKSFKAENPAELFISSAEQQEPKARKKVAPAQPAESPGKIPKGYILTQEPKSQRLNLLIRSATKEALREEAAEQGTSTNDLINQIIENYLTERGKL